MEGSAVVITTTISVLLYFCITKYFYPLLVLLDVDIWANFKNACIMAVVEWRTTLQLLITAGLLDLMLLLFTYQALPFYIIILCAFNCLLGCSFANQPFEKYFGSEPATSARPPVLINGTASDVTNNTRFISVTPKSDTLFTNTQCISKTLGFLDVRAFALSADRNTRYFVQAQYRAFLSAALLIAYAHYTTLWGSRKYLKCLIQIPYFAAVFVETTLLIRFIFQADSVCNQCYKF